MKSAHVNAFVHCEIIHVIFITPKLLAHLALSRNRVTETNRPQQHNAEL